MSAEDRRRLSGRITRGAAVAMAVALPGSFLALTQSPASAAPLPATYSAHAHADLVDLTAEIKARSNPTDVKSGPRHPRGRVETNGRLPHGC